MGATWIVWHVGFERNLRRRGPRSVDIRSEFQLSQEPLRVDYLILRKRAAPDEVLDDSAETLRRLWPLLPKVAVMEFKSSGHPYRSGNLDRLYAYLHAYYSDQRELPRKRADGTPVLPDEPDAPDVLIRADLCGVLVVPHRTPSLMVDAGQLGRTWEDLGDGYWRARGPGFEMYVLELDVIGPAEGDDLVHFLGSGKVLSVESRQFLMEMVGSQEAGMSMQDMEGYKELMDKLLDTLPAEQVLAHYAPEQRLAGLPPEQVLPHFPPEQRLAGLPPEQRLADLDRDHQALALPTEVLRQLSDEYLRSLSPDVEVEIRRRLRQNGH